MRAGKVIKKLNLTENCIVAIRSDSELANEKSIHEMIVEAEKLYSGFSVLFIVVDDLDEIDTVSEEDMAKFGWYKVDALREKMKSVARNHDE